jgi:hypothetical protein
MLQHMPSRQASQAMLRKEQSVQGYRNFIVVPCRSHIGICEKNKAVNMTAANSIAKALDSCKPVFL